MASVAHLDDVEGDRLVHLAETLGEENLSEGERWRLANTRDRRRRLEAQANAPSGRTDALSSQALERRFAAIESQAQWADGMLKEVLPQVVGEVIGEAEQRAGDETKRLLDELRIETEQKLNAQYEGFERAVRELRDTDRATILADLRSTMTEAESRIDEHLAEALEKSWERCELEVALVRDELLSVMAEKKYGQLTDDAPKLELAEKAIASLRKRTTALEDDNARIAAMNDQIAAMTNQLATLDAAYQKSRKGLLIRCAANAVTVKKEADRADEMTGRIATLEAALQELVDELSRRKAIK